MACCKNSCNKQLPVESLIDVTDIIGVLTTMATTGIKNFAFKDAPLDKLAEQVSRLAAENNYLKKLASLLSPMSATLIEDTITISFGPANMYALTIPVGTEAQRKSLAEQFQEIADNLKKPKVDAQQLTMFNE